MSYKLRYTYIFLLLLIIQGCSPKAGIQLVRPNLDPISYDTEVFIFGLDESIPVKSKFVGKLEVGEAGMTINCGLDEMIEECFKAARKSGANIIELTKVRPPNFFSSCYCIEANMYLNKSKAFLEGGPENELVYTAEEKVVIDLIQALKQGEYTFYDIDGYSIVQYETSKPFDTKSLRDLKKKFDIDKNDSGSKSAKMERNHLYFSRSFEEEFRSFFEDFYIYSNDKGTATLVQLTSSLARNDAIESTFLKLLTNRELPRYIFTPWEVDSIYFANRYIKLGPVCRWQEIRSIQCPHLGQMDWSEFTTKERADEYIQLWIKIISEKSPSDFISKEEVPVIFEGKKTTAQKIALKSKVSKLILGGSNVLYFYYVTAKINDKYIGCVLSHYSNDNNSPDLPPLLSEVMSLVED